MTVKCLKSCPWGIHSAWGPEFQIEPDMILGDEFPKGTNAKDWADFKVKLIDAGHAVIVPDEKPADDEADVDETENTGDADTGGDAENTDESGLSATPEATPEALRAELEAIALEKMDGPMGSEKKAKASLEEIGKRYGFDVDKRMGIDKIVDAIVEAAFKE